MKRLAVIAFLFALAITSVYGQSSEMYWPQGIVSGKDTIVVYQPQVESWDDNVLKGRSAVQYSSPGKEPAFGIIEFSSRTETDMEENYADLNEVKIHKANFPTLIDNGKAINGLISVKLSEQGRMSLEQIKSSLAISEAVKRQKIDVKNDPPKIVYSSQPAVLVQIDGAPSLQAVNGSSSWQRVINSSTFVLWNSSRKVFELSLFGNWYTTTALDNPWTLDSKPDTQLSSILNSALQADTSIQTFNPPADEIGRMLDNGQSPKIVVTTEPTELLITDGEPVYEPLPNTNLLYVKNTSADMFKYVGDGKTYVLISGRWFRATNVNATWSFVAPDNLPDDFKNISADHPKGSALVSVAGTPQAEEAAISSQIPQTATIDRQNATMQSSYDGTPSFHNIDGTSMQYAINSQTPVILVDNMYYAVYNGVWYNALSANGPWAVAVNIPVSIYSIPASSPIHYVTYVRVYGYTPTVVYVGYTPGYYGCYMNNYGTVVYGTGWRYRPWVGNYWYGNPYSYGFGVGFNWNSWAGWSMSFGYGARYYPVCRPWWGPVAYGPHRPIYANHRQINIYNYNRRNVVINRNYGGAPRYQNNRGRANAVRNSNSYYAGRDGNVYRRSSDGNWQMNRGNGWEPSQQYQQQQMNRDYRGRTDGNNRVQMQENYRSANSGNNTAPDNRGGQQGNNNVNNGGGNRGANNMHYNQNANMYQRPGMGNSNDFSRPYGGNRSNGNNGNYGGNRSGNNNNGGGGAHYNGGGNRGGNVNAGGGNHGHSNPGSGNGSGNHGGRPAGRAR